MRVGEEFSIIAGLGLQKVRLFLLWEDFQPVPDQVSAQALANLAQVADIAADNGLQLDVTFFTGHMSGPNWAPPWPLGGPVPTPPGCARSSRMVSLSRAATVIPSTTRWLWLLRSCSCAR